MTAGIPVFSDIIKLWKSVATNVQINYLIKFNFLFEDKLKA